MGRPDSYTLTEISEWAESKQVALPTVQRGFVWKPNQIENLWDSLLRGYPVGSFVLSYGSRRHEANSRLDLLDGQQRATAICLGFGNSAFKPSADQAKVFIDLESPRDDDNRKYIFRAITKSHPWGYQAADNTKPLDADNIRKAMKLYGVQDHLDAPLDKFFPYDSVLPLPFDLFLKSAWDKVGEKAMMSVLEEWEHWGTINTLWRSKTAGETGGRRRLQLISPESVKAKIVSIYNDVVVMLHGIDGKNARRIPALYLDLNAILAEGVRPPSDSMAAREPQKSDDTDNPKDDEIETLFVRLNAGGTPLRGEELNYSILKSNIGSDLQIRIETACKGLFNPARFITIAYRLFQLCDETAARDAISMKIKPKQFQRTMTDKKASKDFTAYLADLVDAKDFEGNCLLEYTRNILVYDERDNPQGLPYLVASKLSSSAPEVMFILLYRLKMIGDRPSPMKTPTLHRRMLGIVTLFTWLGKGEKLRDHAKLLSNVWPAAAQEAEQFWSSATVQRAMLDGVLPQLPTFVQLKKVNGAVRQSNSDMWSRFESVCGANSFVFRKIFNNRDLILYAQRHALLEWFDDRVYHLDDTDVPFDWDHIFPHKYVKGKRKIPKILRESYNTNGNFRAWPYPLNRGDQDVLPSIKLNPSPSNTNDYAEMVKSWQKYFDGRPRIRGDLNHLPAQLLKWSKCDEKWTTTRITDVKRHFRQVYELIIERNLNLCREWYEELMIDSLISVRESISSLDIFLNNTKWREMPKKFADRFEDLDENVFKVSSPVEVLGSRFYFYLCCPSSNEDDLAENLKENATVFGVIDEAIDGTLAKVRMSTEAGKVYQMSEVGVIDNSFTLISCHEHHYLQLFAQLHGWLVNFPAKELCCLPDHFLKCLKTDYRERVLSYTQVPLGSC